MFSSLLIVSALAQVQPPGQDLQQQLDALEKKVQELELKQSNSVSANPLNLLNPSITAIGNFLWRIDNDDVLTEEGEEIDDTANLREAELDLRAAIDPYADGVFILALESEIPGEYEAGVEEFYATIKSLPLPYWEEPPLGAKIKVGRFRSDFGRGNTLHLHDLPQSTRPLIIEEFLGEEGHLSSGVSTQCFLPSPGDSALELTLQALQGGGIEISQDRRHPAFLANLRLFVPVADHHSIDLSIIGFYGINDPDGHRQSRAWSLDAFYRWKPDQGSSFVLGGQILGASHEFKTDSTGDGEITSDDDAFATDPMGYSLWAQYQVSKPLYLGLRWDDSDFIDNDDLNRRKIQGYASWYLSEFFRMRGSVESSTSDDPEEDELLTFLLEATFIYGAHPPHPYWVNK